MVGVMAGVNVLSVRVRREVDLPSSLEFLRQIYLRLAKVSVHFGIEPIHHGCS